jgi:hypothetical protein
LIEIMLHEIKNKIKNPKRLGSFRLNILKEEKRTARAIACVCKKVIPYI